MTPGRAVSLQVVQKLTQMVGKNVKLYDMVLQFLRTLFLRTRNVHYCTLRAELLMSLHELDVGDICSVDPCHKVAAPPAPPPSGLGLPAHPATCCVPALRHPSHPGLGAPESEPAALRLPCSPARYSSGLPWAAVPPLLRARRGCFALQACGFRGRCRLLHGCHAAWDSVISGGLGGTGV